MKMSTGDPWWVVRRTLGAHYDHDAGGARGSGRVVSASTAHARAKPIDCLLRQHNRAVSRLSLSHWMRSQSLRRPLARRWHDALDREAKAAHKNLISFLTILLLSLTRTNSLSRAHQVDDSLATSPRSRCHLCHDYSPAWPRYPLWLLSQPEATSCRSSTALLKCCNCCGTRLQSTCIQLRGRILGQYLQHAESLFHHRTSPTRMTAA